MRAGVQKKVLSVHVVVDVLSRDRLRKFSFGLDKATGKDETESWAIHFNLYEREKTADPFGDALIHADVGIKARNFPKAEVTAARGFNQAQTERALVEVAAVSGRVKSGKASPARLAKAIEGVIESREV